jgi:hypothetical protein
MAPAGAASASAARQLPSPVETERGLKSQSQIDAVHTFMARRVRWHLKTQ